METLNFKDIRLKYPFLEWVMIHSIIIKDKLNEILSKDGTYTFEFKINGIDLPILETFADLQKEDEKRIKSAAAELFQEEIDNFHNIFDDMIEKAKLSLSEKYSIYFDSEY